MFLKIKKYIKEKRLVERIKLTYILLSGREYYNVNSANTENVNHFIASRVGALHDLPPCGTPCDVRYEDWMVILSRIEESFRKMKKGEESRQSKKCIEGLNLFIVHLGGLWD